jgi:hypothetical protein
MAGYAENFGNYAKSGGLGGGLAGIGSGLYNLFGYKNPADSSAPYLDKAYNNWEQLFGNAQQYMNPYIQAGQRAMPTLENQFNSLINDPTKLMEMIGSKFQASPGYQYNVDQATNAAKNLGAASGMAGSQASQQELASQVHGMANQDFNQFLQNALGQYNTGLRGLEGQSNTGYNASNSVIQALLQQLTGQSDIAKTQAENAYAGAANKNQSQGGGFGSALGGLASLLSGFL